MNTTATQDAELGTASDSTISQLRVEGMTCNNCARHVTEAIQGVMGVQSASVSLTSNRASVRWHGDADRNISAIVSAIKSAGYEAKLVEPSAQTDGQSHGDSWHLNLWLGGVVTALLMLGEWVFHLSIDRWFQWLAFGLASVVQIVCGAQFYRGAWRQLKIASSNMDTLVALGSTTAFGYSTWALLTGAGGHLYFMEAAAIITLISLGHWVEARVSERASGALKSLLELTPATARRLGAPASSTPRADSKFNPLTTQFTVSTPAANVVETEVPVADLRAGDHVALRPGDRVPVDGIVAEGDSAVDESMLTGESKPVDKVTNSELYAGTVNLNGRLVMRVTKTGEATALASIIAAVQRAQTSRADIQRLGDRVSNVFVPIVVVIALAAGLWWGFAPASASKVFHTLSPYLWAAHPPAGVAAGFIIAAAVLIIACPCAMGLATPAAIMASANAAAKRGILIRDGVALEKAGTITAVVFDKTGTLTQGRPEVAAIGAPVSDPARFETIKADARSETGAPVELAAGLASHSTHPISRAVAKLAKGVVKVADWREVRGAGVEATQDGKVVRLGSLRWLGESSVDVRAGEQFIAEWSGQGATIVGLAIGDALAGLFAVRDALKPGARAVVEQLHRQGLNSYLLTGDNQLTARSIAKQAGVAEANVFAEVKPEQKAEFIQKLQAQGERLAFVGDGINDAPALTQADLGIAVSRASDVAREAADIILLKSEIEAVPEALGLARATLRTIKQNLFWAFFYNALGIPLAALGFMSPVLCAAAMGFSDLIVIGNALRLRQWRLK